MPQLAANLWADGPASAPFEPFKPDLRDWGTWIEGIIAAFLGNGGLIYTSRALLYADLTQPANSSAWVYGDATVAYNGVYRKIGAANTGSWTRVADLPYSFIIANDAGAGTPNAIQATTSIPISASALIWMNIADTNTAAPVTVQFNGGAVLTVKTNSGNNVAASGLVAGMIVLGIVSGSTFRLVSDQASAAIVAAAEAAQAAAEAAAAGVNFKNVADRTALKALNTAVTTLAFLGEPGRDGAFKWTTGDFSTQITADTQEGVYVKANSIASTAGAWVRAFERLMATSWFSTTEQNAIGEIFQLATSQPYMYMADSHIGIVKDGAPLNYFGTRASLVLQHADTANGAAQELIPGVQMDFDFSGNGVVDAPNRFSETIWTALNVFTKKTGNGSAHCFTSAGELGAPAASGYNELGGFQGSLTNVGSDGGNISGLEFLVKDSPDGGTTKYPTYGKPVISRGSRYHAAGYWTSFLASSEGGVPLNAVLGLNPDGPGEWTVGIDFTGRPAPFTTGAAMFLPNNTNITWKTSGGALAPILLVDAANTVQLRMSTAAAALDFNKANGDTRMRVDNNANDAVHIWVGGGLRRVGLGAPNSAGAGFSQLIVANP